MDLEVLLARLFPACPAARRQFLAPLLEAAMAKHGVTTPGRIAAFLAQAGHESAELTRFEENLNYSLGALRRTWPTRFPDAETAARYARRPEAIANRAYGGRLGNGPELSGDGWRYRGRGLIQITGRENYRRFGRRLGLDLEALPEQAAEPAVACSIAALYWETNGCSELADLGDFETITRRINGGLNGQAERVAYHERAQALLAGKDAAA